MSRSEVLVRIGAPSDAGVVAPQFVALWPDVEPEHRRCGVGRALVAAAEAWARSQGCTEMASDAQLDNRVSLEAHEALGFEVVDRCVHFRKRLPT